ncbi:MAG: outer membrane beta-barrel protein [Cyclonatronaceae bacterium]
MKILFLIVVTLLLVSVPYTTTAGSTDDEPRFSLGFYTGPVLPTGEERLTDYWGIGFITGFQSGYFITENIQLRAEIDYSMFSFRRARFREENNYPESQYKITNNTSSTMVLSGAALYYLPLNREILLYAGISGGMMYVEIGDINVGDGDEQLTASGSSKSGFSAGFSGGVEMCFWPSTSLFSELGYRYGYTPRSRTHYVPLKLGINVYL